MSSYYVGFFILIFLLLKFCFFSFLFLHLFPSLVAQNNNNNNNRNIHFRNPEADEKEKISAGRTVSSPSSSKRVVRSTTTTISTAVSAARSTTSSSPLSTTTTTTLTTRSKLTKSKSDNPDESKVTGAKKIFQGKWQKHVAKPVKEATEHYRGGEKFAIPPPSPPQKKNLLPKNQN